MSARMSPGQQSDSTFLILQHLAPILVEVKKKKEKKRKGEKKDEKLSDVLVEFNLSNPHSYTFG